MSAMKNYALALETIAAILEDGGNYGDATAEEYAAYATIHNLDPATVNHWAHEVTTYAPGESVLRLLASEWIEALVLDPNKLGWFDTALCDYENCDAPATRALHSHSVVWTFCDAHPRLRPLKTSEPLPPYDDAITDLREHAWGKTFTTSDGVRLEWVCDMATGLWGYCQIDDDDAPTKTRTVQTTDAPGAGLQCAECGNNDAPAYVVTGALEDSDGRTEVCDSCNATLNAIPLQAS